MFRQNRQRYSARKNFSKISGGQRGYVQQGAGSRTHTWTQALSGTPAALTPDNYFYVTLAKFKRSFSTTVDDVPPTPTVKSNYQTANVFNGSKIIDFQSIIHLQNNDNTNAVYLDVYMLSYSFWDAYIQLLGTPYTPVNFVSVVGANDLRGEVNPYGPVATVFIDNFIKSQKFLQRYLKKIGTVQIGNNDNNNKIDIKFDRLPAKCRRSQTGMFCGVFFVNNSNLNQARTLNIEGSAEISFNEIPSSERKPYLD